jgi:hypothetical protein
MLATFLISSAIIVGVAYPIGFLIVTFVPKQWLLIILHEGVLANTILSNIVLGLLFFALIGMISMLVIYPVYCITKSIRNSWKTAKMMLEEKPSFTISGTVAKIKTPII